MTVREIKLLADGFFQLDMGMLVWMKARYYGVKYRCALKPLLVITDDEKILIDTGCGDPPAKVAQMNGVEKPIDLPRSLKKAGLEPDDITVVLNTHLHFDHCGWNKIFKNARQIVQKAELDYAHNPHRFMKGGYYKPWFEDLDFDLLKGDTELFDGVKVVMTPGHTPGHQSVVLDLEDKRYIYCGDVSPIKENLERMNVIGTTVDPVQCLESMAKIKEMDGIFIYSHDNTQMDI